MKFIRKNLSTMLIILLSMASIFLAIGQMQLRARIDWLEAHERFVIEAAIDDHEFKEVYTYLKNPIGFVK